MLLLQTMCELFDGMVLFTITPGDEYPLNYENPTLIH